MRLISLALFVLALGSRTALAAPAPAEDPEDLLGNLVIEAGEVKGKALVLMRIGVEPVLGDAPDAARVQEVLRRDLELSGQFELVTPQADPPEGDIDDPIDVDAWSGTRVAAVIRVRTERPGDGQMRLRAALLFADEPNAPGFTSTVVAPTGKFRANTHRLVDKLMGALTGYDGPFTSRLTFVRTLGKTRAVYTIDADGKNLEKVSDAGQLVATPAIGPDDVPYWAGSVDHGRYRVYRQGQAEPIAIEPTGSVYGIAFSDDRTKVALSIATDKGIELFTGPSDFTGLTPRGKLPMALHPTFSSSGQIAVAGTTKKLQRVYVDGRAVSIPGLSASAPTFCRHPDGNLVAYAVGVRDRSDIIVADTHGRDAARLTKGKGRNSYPACSPDGRLIAFFSTRTSGEGPGLYVMRTDGRRPRKIATVLGDSLRWARVRPVPER